MRDTGTSSHTEVGDGGEHDDHGGDDVVKTFRLDFVSFESSKSKACCIDLRQARSIP